MVWLVMGLFFLVIWLALNLFICTWSLIRIVKDWKRPHLSLWYMIELGLRVSVGTYILYVFIRLLWAPQLDHNLWNVLWAFWSGPVLLVSIGFSLRTICLHSSNKTPKSAQITNDRGMTRAQRRQRRKLHRRKNKKNVSQSAEESGPLASV